MARPASGVVEQNNALAERSPSEWERAFKKEREQLSITSASQSAFDSSCDAEVPAIQPIFAETASAESRSVSPKERRIPGLNRSHSDIELQLADLLEEAQLAGGECTGAKYFLNISWGQTCRLLP